MPEQALLDAGARLVGKTQMDELVRSFPNCLLFLQRSCWRWLRPCMHISCAQDGTGSTGWTCSRTCAE